jgi:hypothetical protein
VRLEVFLRRDEREEAVAPEAPIATSVELEAHRDGHCLRRGDVAVGRAPPSEGGDLGVVDLADGEGGPGRNPGRSRGVPAAADAVLQERVDAIEVAQRLPTCNDKTPADGANGESLRTQSVEIDRRGQLAKMGVVAEDDLALGHRFRVGDDRKLDGRDLLQEALEFFGCQQGPFGGVIRPDDLELGSPVLRQHQGNRRRPAGPLPPHRSRPQPQGDPHRQDVPQTGHRHSPIDLMAQCPPHGVCPMIPDFNSDGQSRGDPIAARRLPETHARQVEKEQGLRRCRTQPL